MGIDYELPVLNAQEEETIFPTFNADIAFDLGSCVRRLAQDHGPPVAIDITLASGQLMFHCSSKPGTNIDNQEWIKRKRATVLRFGRSSFYIGCKLRKDQRELEKAFFISEKEYCTHGGGLPIRVAGTEGVYAVLCVSGLRQDMDHELGIKAMKETIANIHL
ncbi:hypothetical protein NADFUDRAFT_80901 [Nadsonia fulvescens var. elongata DSM 6958]|uniref:DUF336-domain-containing protein n=1 Tax=Nadsonia fulvescens var. elongata DSM 6958 TaxID=857566 RepID=A0A1E3PQY9_9ASCO|nr:hypothetical protein NADFUDRAFT_80901 [Nadsonia fulvescens var. elongata DSM 6958]